MSSNQNGTLEREMYPHQTPHLGDSGSQHPPNTQLSTSVDSIVIATSMGESGTVVPPPYSPEEASVPVLRGSLDCWACSVLVATQNLIIVIVNAGLAALVLGLILSPAIIMVVFGFLCHSTVRPHSTSYYCLDLLTDGGCVTLLVVGFLLVTPLLVLALAAYCRLARHLQLGLCFIPYSRAVYKNLPARRHHGFPGNLCGQQEVVESEGKGSVWV